MTSASGFRDWSKAFTIVFKPWICEKWNYSVCFMSKKWQDPHQILPGTIVKDLKALMTLKVRNPDRFKLLGPWVDAVIIIVIHLQMIRVANESVWCNFMNNFSGL